MYKNLYPEKEGVYQKALVWAYFRIPFAAAVTLSSAVSFSSTISVVATLAVSSTVTFSAAIALAFLCKGYVGHSDCGYDGC